MHAFIINLARSEERRSHMVAQLAGTAIDFEFVEAIDGRVLSLADDRIADPQKTTGDRSERWSATWSSPGVAACTLSHLRVYERILEKDLAVGLVLEDDVCLPEGLHGILDAIEGHLKGAEVVLLNFDSRDRCRLSSDGSVPVNDQHRLLYPVDPDQLCSAAGYVITRDACTRMLAMTLPLRACSDDWGFFVGHDVIDRVRCLVPAPVRKDPSFGSTIEYNKLGGVKSRMRSRVLRSRFPPVRWLVVVRRRLAFRRWTRTEVVDLHLQGESSTASSRAQPS